MKRKHGKRVVNENVIKVQGELSIPNGPIKNIKPYVHPKKLVINEGDVFGRLTIIREVEKKGVARYFECKCECGTVRDFKIYRLTDGTTVSCGCYGRENSSKILKGKKTPSFVTGDHNKNSDHYYLTRTWGGMKQRCYNPNSHKFPDYGERGIRVYEPWIDDYVAFKTWILDNLGERPETYTLDRIDVNGNYEPGNLRWADKKTQTKNRRPWTRKNKNQLTLTLN